MNVVLCADENYVRFAAVVMVTTLIHCRDRSRLHFYILTPGLTLDARRHLQAMVESYGARLEIIVAEQALSKESNLGRFGASALMRLYMHRYLPVNCQRAVYLDCDLLVLGDITPLWDCDLKGMAVGAVIDLCSPAAYAKAGQAHRPPYCNTGVLVVDIPLWRARCIGEQALAYIQINLDNLRYFDQDALNHVLAGQWLSLDLAWNFQPTVYSAIEKRYAYLQSRRSELKQAIRQPKIVHFIGGVKPWHATCTHPLQDLFFHFSNYTPWPLDKSTLLATLPWPKRLHRASKRIKIWQRRRKLQYRVPD